MELREIVAGRRVQLGRGRMHAGAVSFTYRLKTSSRTGEETGELIISSKASDGKTVTRSSVELAMKNALEVMEKEGMVRGPKKLGQVFGGSYLYAMFLSWGVITNLPNHTNPNPDPPDTP